MATFTDTRTFVVVSCCVCGIEFGMPTGYYGDRKKDHKSWSCPNGHRQHFTGKTDAEKLQEQLERERRTKQWLQEERDAARDLADHERNRANGYKGALTKTKRRIAGGVCPCCNRSFTDLAAHIAGQHPHYVEENA